MQQLSEQNGKSVCMCKQALGDRHVTAVISSREGWSLGRRCDTPLPELAPNCLLFDVDWVRGAEGSLGGVAFELSLKLHVARDMELN